MARWNLDIFLESEYMHDLFLDFLSIYNEKVHWKLTIFKDPTIIRDPNF